MRAVATATGFHGLCGFDWVIDENEGRAKMIEFHPRPPSGFGIGHWAGVFFDRAIAGLLREESVAPQRPNPQLYRHHDVCCYFPDHPLYCWKMKDWQELQRWLPLSHSHSWAMLPWDDPTFLVHTLRRLLIGSSPAAVHKK